MFKFVNSDRNKSFALSLGALARKRLINVDPLGKRVHDLVCLALDELCQLSLIARAPDCGGIVPTDCRLLEDTESCQNDSDVTVLDEIVLAIAELRQPFSEDKSSENQVSAESINRLLSLCLIVSSQIDNMEARHNLVKKIEAVASETTNATGLRLVIVQERQDSREVTNGTSVEAVRFVGPGNGPGIDRVYQYPLLRESEVVMAGVASLIDA